MLFRRSGDEVIAIPQPGHAWLSGQLARAWGNREFPRPEPWEEVCLGTEQHDIGWIDWETAPTLNLRTSLPHQFHEVATATHIGLWTAGTQRALASYGRYPALLVSLHARTIYEAYFDIDKAPPEEAARVRTFLSRQAAFRDMLIAGLRNDPRLAPHVDEHALERNRRFVAAADRISLALCGGVRERVVVPDVPARGGPDAALVFAAVDGDPDRLTVDPWPFAAGEVALQVEGAVLAGLYADEETMRAAIAGAPRVSLRLVLRPI